MEKDMFRATFVYKTVATLLHEHPSFLTFSKEMESSSAPATDRNLLHTSTILRHAYINRAFALIYTLGLFALLYRHTLTLLRSPTTYSLLLLVSDVILGFMWSTTQSFRMRPVIRHAFPENIENIMSEKDFPPLDIFICTADPRKEPPISVVNTALSVMAYDYPSHKISVYVSDDGGSQLTLFAFMEAAKFARVWIPFCRKKNIMQRNPDVFLRSHFHECYETEDIKIMYENMKTRVEDQVKRGKVSGKYRCSEQERQTFNKWSKDFSPRNHPPIIQVLLKSDKDRDTTGDFMPNLIYVSRQKSSSSPHHFKAGALNALLRVSTTMTNAPLVLTLDCDMYSTDPTTALRVLCFLSDASNEPELAYIQFPQRYHGLNKGDIYGSEYKRVFICNPIGMNGFAGPNYVGTGCFFRRRAFFGGPSLVTIENQDLSPNPSHKIVDKSTPAQSVLELAHNVATCNYEDNTAWGSKIGFRYGSLVEDYYTGYRLHCQGWKSALCHPDRPAFLGDIPITLEDVLNQNKRWSVGLLEVAFSRYSPLTFGVSSMGLCMGYSYAHNAFWSILSIPITIYAFLPQLALIAHVSKFPKMNDVWVCLYVFLFLGAYVQDCVDFIIHGGTFQRWWNEQRMWLARGISSYLFGMIEYTFKHLSISIQGFDLTSKVQDNEQSKRYVKGKFEFGVASPMFVPLASAALLNLIAVVEGSIFCYRSGNVGELLVQMFIASFGVLNCLPIYEAMFLRSDNGRMPTRITIVAAFVAAALYATANFI